MDSYTPPPINCNKVGGAADIAASDAAIGSLALQYGADIEVIRRALSRDGQGHSSRPLGAALDLIVTQAASTIGKPVAESTMGEIPF